MRYVCILYIRGFKNNVMFVLIVFEIVIIYISFEFFINNDAFAAIPNTLGNGLKLLLYLPRLLWF